MIGATLASIWDALHWLHDPKTQVFVGAVAVVLLGVLFFLAKRVVPENPAPPSRRSIVFMGIGAAIALAMRYWVGSGKTSLDEDVVPIAEQALNVVIVILALLAGQAVQRRRHQAFRSGRT